MSFIHDKTATVTFIGDYYTISTTVDAPADGLDQEMEPIIVEKALAFIKEYYGWDLGSTWFDYSIELRNADGSHLGE
jgi:hypothetical protein